MAAQVQDADGEPVAFPARRLRIVLTHWTIGDGVFCTLVSDALRELAAADPGGRLMEFGASNGVEIKLKNLDTDDG